MIVGLKSYSGTKNSGIGWIGEVPTHWEVTALRNRYEQCLGKMLDTKRGTGEHLMPYLRNVDVQWDRINVVDLPQIDIRPEEVERYTVRPGDLLVCEGGEVGRSAIWMGEIEQCAYQKALHRLRPRRRGRDRPRFLLHALRLAVERGAFYDGHESTIGHLTGEKLRAHRFAFPPESEQRRIEVFLDHTNGRIQRYIEAKQNLIALLEEQKQAIAHQAITGQVDVKTGGAYRAYKDGGTRWLRQVPKHWDIRRAKWHFREVDERSETGSEELLSVSHITGVTPRKEKNVTMFMAESNIGDKVCQPGDVIVNTMWAWMAALGVARQTGIVSPSYAVYRPHGHSELLPGYTELLLRSTPYRSEYNCQSTGIRASRLRLYPEQFLRIRLLCPPVDEQRTIIEFAEKTTETIRRSINVTRSQLSRIHEFRARIIAEVVTGKVDVRTATALLPEDDLDDTNDQRDDDLKNDATAYPKARKAGYSDCTV